jgi:protein-L-isoaspartate(D-aspartate) O-methyltransferase
VASLRRHGIADERVLAAMAAVPRERFVPQEAAASAYADRPLPIGHDVTISQPYIVARMLELAELARDDRVLDVGTGSGYAAAVTARLVAEVVSVERVPELAARAADVLADLGLDVEVEVGDGHEGWPARAPYDAIVVAAAPTDVPSALTEQLVDGGRLVLPVGGRHRVQELVVVRRRGDTLERTVHDRVRFVPLVDDR